eukprot:1131455_1
MALTGLAIHELPTTIRQSKAFLSKLKRVEIIKARLNDKQHQGELGDIFHEKRDWQHLPVFTNDHEVNKTQHKCTKTKHVFINDCTKAISNAMTPIDVVAILFFNLITGGIDIDAGLRLRIEDCDMVITFKYVNSKRSAPYVLPTAIHLDVLFSRRRGI